MKLLVSDCLWRAICSDSVCFALFWLNWFALLLCTRLHSLAFCVACTTSEKWNLVFSKGCPVGQICAWAFRIKSLALGFELKKYRCYFFHLKYIFFTLVARCCGNCCKGSCIYDATSSYFFLGKMYFSIHAGPRNLTMST